MHDRAMSRRSAKSSPALTRYPVPVSKPGQQLPLDGISVVDLTSNIAAPFASAILADLGASVVHVESPFGDDSRRMSPTHGEGSAYFYVVNRNKTFHTLDLRTEVDQQALEGLLAEADVLVSNLRPRKLVELELDERSLRSRFPGLITAYLNAYGPSPDEANQAGYDGVIQARTGILGVTGDASPARAGVSVLDMGAGMWLALGVVGALFKRTTTGVGSSVETSLLETGVSWSAYHLVAHQFSGEASTRSGTGHPAFAPYGLFPTADSEVMIGVGGDAVFGRLARAIGRADLLSDARFATNASRVENNVELRSALSQSFVGFPSAELISLLRAADVPADLAQLPEDLLIDPAAQSQLCEVAVPGGAAKIPAIPLRFDGEYPRVRFLF